MSAPMPRLSEDATDLFQTSAWFDSLLSYGFVAPPEHHALRWPTAHGEVCLHLMRAEKNACLTALSNYYSCLYGPVGPAHALTINDWHLVASQMRRCPGSATVQLQPLDAQAPWLGGLEEGLRAVGYTTDRFFCFGNWYHPVKTGGFAVYWAARPSALRHSVERGRRRLDKSGDWCVDIVTGDRPDLQQAIDAYVSVYNQSWKQPEPCADFMPGLIRTASREGWLRLGLLIFQGQVIAAQVWLTQGDKANIYKLAYVKGFEKLSAGSVLTAALMQHAIDVDQVREVDYLSGDDAYKSDWMDMRRERIGLVAFDRRHWRGWLAESRHILGRWRRFWRLLS